MKRKIDAIILAGDKTASRGIFGKNKLFLEIEKTPLLVFVLKALEEVDQIENILIVGPKESVESVVESNSHRLNNNKPINVIEQKENMYRNFWSGFIHSIPGYKEGMEKENREVMEKMVLVMSCDLPFITAGEVKEFLDSSDAEELDYCLGMTEERYLEKFYPNGTSPGIKMGYLHLREGNFRLNNLHLVRPFKILNREYIEKIFERRYQKNILNMIKILFDIIFVQRCGVGAIFSYIILEIALLLEYLGFSELAKITKNIVPQSKMRLHAARLLKTRIDIVQTTVGGCALDVDNETDFETIRQRYREWKTRLEKK